MRRPNTLALGLPLALATAWVAWAGLGLPPLRGILAYGPAPGCEPTAEFEVEGVRFVAIGPGIARIGSARMAAAGDRLGRVAGPTGVPWGEAPAPSPEMPVHWVEFPRGFAIAVTEVTNAQYEAFDPRHERSRFSPGDRDPVVMVSFEDANAYCAWLALKSGRPVRLPSEAEWECACRAGERGEWAFGDDEADLGGYAWTAGNSERRAHAVATKRANAWGLYDFHGNVFEWCEDRWLESYSTAEPDLPAWLLERGRVVRGGGWPFGPSFCRAAFRVRRNPGDRWPDVGFRPAIGPGSPGPGDVRLSDMGARSEVHDG